MPTTFFGRMVVFVLVLLALRLFFRWNISIVGSVLLTLAITYGFRYFDSKREEGETD